MKIHDLSLDIETRMPTCGTEWHQEVMISQLGKIENVGRNTHSFIVGSHSGTHMDAPYHFIDNGKTIENIDVRLMWGRVTVVDFRYKKQGDVVTLNDVMKIDVKERLLFAFGWYHNWNTEDYYNKFPYFEVEAVEYLLSNGMKVMALDTPSPDNGAAIKNNEINDSPNHKLLLQNEAVIIEYLTNTDVLVGGKEYEMVAAPLRFKGADGSPARVLLKEEEV